MATLLHLTVTLVIEIETAAGAPLTDGPDSSGRGGLRAVLVVSHVRVGGPPGMDLTTRSSPVSNIGGLGSVCL
ncbi:hypothetical protein LY78DRAFT_501652 [Colletotrichum sublineola]|nr:hypothetical protein LY78DRAFT_501652 [Colletotrichum sublineola]